MKKINENGASMVEVLGVLAIVCMMSIGAFSGIATIQSKIKLQKAQSEISDLVKGMREQFSAFQPSSSSGEISPSKLQKAGIFKADNAGNSFGTTTQIFHNKETEEDDPTFEIHYNDIPSKVCIDLLMADWGSDPSSGLQAIKVSSGSKGFYWKKNKPDCKTEAHCLPPSLETAAEECSTKDTVNLIWHYYY